MRICTIRRALTAAFALGSVAVSLAAQAAEPAPIGVEFGQPAPPLVGDTSLKAERFEVLFGNRAEQHAAVLAARQALKEKDAALSGQIAETERQASALQAERERLLAASAAEGEVRAKLEAEVGRLARTHASAVAELEAGKAERVRLAEQVSSAEARLATASEEVALAKAEAESAKVAAAATAKLRKFEITPEDHSVRQVITRWAEGAGYQVAWTVGEQTDWTVEFGGAFGEHFPAAVDALVVGVNQYLVNTRGRAQVPQLLSADVHSNGIVRIYFTQSAN